MTSEIFQAVIIGAGQGGIPLATALADAGHKTALVERAYPGGSCINYGCTPTKTMVASARIAHLARRTDGYGVQAGPVTVDMAAVRQRKRDMVTQFRQGIHRRIENSPGLEFIHGEASFIGDHSLEVALIDGGYRQLIAERIIIDTGSRPDTPSLKGIERVPTLNSTSIMELESLPDHLLVLGGGYVGLEFAQMFRRFGSQVTIVQRSDQLLPREDQDIAAELANILAEEGIEILLNCQPIYVDQDNHIQIRLRLKNSNEQGDLSGTHLLVATGRVPNTEKLNLSAAGIETDRQGFISVNERLETNVQGIYAIGDVNGGPAFTHVSYDDFRILRDNLIIGKERTTRDRLIPYTVFTDPELGRVGLTERQARHQGLNYQVVKMPMSHVARALEMGEPRGVLKALVESGSDQILGAAVLGVNGGELMAVLQMAMLGKIPAAVIREMIFTHPTLAESLNNLFMQME